MRRVLAASVILLLAAGHAPPARAAGTGIQRVSVSRAGAQADRISTSAVISGDGHHVAFISFATTLVAGDVNDNPDAFVRDLRTGRVERVNVPGGERQSYLGIENVAISRTGRYAAFSTAAPDVVPGDTNGAPDVFVRDRTAGPTTRVSVPAAGGQANGASGIGPGALSGDGRYVVFWSAATNLVPGDTNQGEDFFVRDLKRGTTTRVDVSTAGKQGNQRGIAGRQAAISADGRYVAFLSPATNLVPGDTNEATDVFVRDRRLGRTGRLSISTAGAQAAQRSDEVAISAGGRYVGFRSWAPNLVAGSPGTDPGIYVRDMVAHTTERVSLTTTGAPLNREASGVSLSADGRYVTFHTAADAVTPGTADPPVFDAYVRDRRRATTTRIPVTPDGRAVNGHSYGTTLSADGRRAAFTSAASDLVPGDTNNEPDAFVRRLR